MYIVRQTLSPNFEKCYEGLDQYHLLNKKIVHILYWHYIQLRDIDTRHKLVPDRKLYGRQIY